MSIQKRKIEEPQSNSKKFKGEFDDAPPSPSTPPPPDEDMTDLQQNQIWERPPLPQLDPKKDKISK